MKSEAAVQREVVRYLKALGAKVWRVGQRDARGTQDAGVSDLIVFHGGRCLFLEVKSATGKQRTEQREFEAAVRTVGKGTVVSAESTLTFYCACTEYAVVRSLADVDRVLNSGTNSGGG